MALLQLQLDIKDEYKSMINQYLMIVSSLIFLILLEPSDKFNSGKFLFYIILGNIFYNLIVKELIEIV